MVKYLIINADDFGLSEIFNETIIDLIRKDLINSTTVMVDRVKDDQKEQVKELITLSSKNLSIGLHLELEENNYLSQIKSQYQKFNKIFGFKPSHIDIHKAHNLTNSFSDVVDFCKENNLPLRNNGIFFENAKTTFSKAFFGSIEDFSKIEEWVKTFKDEKYYEILFHPGKFDPNCKSSLNKDRERDIEQIKKLNTILGKNNIKAISYVDLSAAL